MKKLTSLLITLLIAGGVVAQQPDDQRDPKRKKGKGRGSEEKAAAGGGQQAAPAKAEAKKAPAAPKVEKREARRPQEAPAAPVAKKRERRQEAQAPGANKSAGEPAAKKRNPAKAENNAVRTESAPNGANKAKKGERARAERDNRSNANAKSTAESAGRERNPAARRNEAQPAPAVSGERRERRERRPGAARRPAPEKVQEIRAKHQNFRAEPRPDRVPSVTFDETRRIEHSDRWEGPQYEVFRSYRPERHDESYYRSNYDRVELFSGGYYYQRNNYWYPAWGYQPSNEYYAYDGPIYAGRRADPPDRVIADVQDALLDQGYYKGDVDGLLGPLTREALAGYQSDEGLQPTAAIDEPTLDALGLQ